MSWKQSTILTLGEKSQNNGTAPKMQLENQPNALPLSPIVVALLLSRLLVCVWVGTVVALRRMLSIAVCRWSLTVLLRVWISCVDGYAGRNT